MTDEKNNVNRFEADAVEQVEDTLAEPIRVAFDAVGPTPEQEQRMLSALVAAQDELATQGEAGLQGAQAAEQRQGTQPAQVAQGAEPAQSAHPAQAEENPQMGQDAQEAEAAAAQTVRAEHAGHDIRLAQTAQAAQDAEPAQPAQPAQAAQAAQPASPAPNRSRKPKVWKVALPLAACLVVGVVLVGVMGQGQQNAELAPSAVSTAASDAAGSTDSAADPTSGKAEKQALSADEAEGERASEAEEAVDGMAYTAAPEAMSLKTDALGSTALDDDVIVAPDDFNTEEYDASEECGFTLVKTSPLSTVSADVDTASYCNLRRMINDGYALSDIPTGAVRIEEMLNYFDYSYAAPTGGDKFSIQAQAGACPWNEDTQLLVLGFATAEESKAAQAGSNLVFLVDVSGSMNSPDKLDLLQDSFATLLENLGPNDRVSIVTYADGEDIVLEGAKGDDDKEILRAIYKLRAGGSTNGEAGLKQAYEVAERNFIEGGVNRIVMASDGDLNVGMTSESELHDFVDAKRESGIYLSVLGFGSGNYKDNKMETVADHGNGSYHYIDSIEEAERVLKDKLTANLVPFADNVKVQVEFNPAQVKAYRLIGYDNRMLAAEDFRDDAVDAGDVGPNSQFTVAYEVVPVDSKMKMDEPELKYGNSASAEYAHASGDWLTCSLRYHDFDGDEMREQQLAVDGSALAATPSDDWKLAAAVIEFGMLARDSKYAGTASVDAIVDLLGTNLDEQRDAFKRLVMRAG